MVVKEKDCAFSLSLVCIGIQLTLLHTCEQSNLSVNTATLKKQNKKPTEKVREVV